MLTTHGASVETYHARPASSRPVRGFRDRAVHGVAAARRIEALPEHVAQHF